MIQIIVTDEKMIDPMVDELGRDRVGYKPGMSQLAMYDANHGCWVLGPRAEREQYAVFVHKGEGIQALEIDHIERVASGPDARGVIHGNILKAGHDVYEAYVGKPAPNPGVRNPVTYFDSPIGATRPCQCGCGAAAKGKDFLPGHDQTALHARVKQIGTVAEFLEWFDNLAAPLSATNK